MPILTTGINSSPEYQILTPLAQTPMSKGRDLSPAASDGSSDSKGSAYDIKITAKARKLHQTFTRERELLAQEYTTDRQTLETEFRQERARLEAEYRQKKDTLGISLYA